MSGPLAIELKGVGRTFRRRGTSGGYTTLKTQLVRTFTGRQAPEKERILTVLHDIDLEVPQGATLGVVGQNGSGKSTLLKVIAGVYRPTSGRVHIEGRLSALIELGAGFHPEFSGRENIYINGLIVGRNRRELDALIDPIIDFAELRDFIDEPVRTYSSGMYMRLAFSVAIHVDPDVLVIDEILGVGDEHFQRKSRERIDDFKRSGKTLVLVTHDAATVQSWCDMAVWLDQGTIAAKGDPRQVVGAYRSAIAAREEAGRGTVAVGPALLPTEPIALRPEEPRPWLETSPLEIRGAREAGGAFQNGDSLAVRFNYRQPTPVPGLVFALGLFHGGELLWSSRAVGPESLAQRTDGEVQVVLERLDLFPGDYLLRLTASRAGTSASLFLQERHFSVHTDSSSSGPQLQLAHRWDFSAAEGPPALQSAGGSARLG
jgi:lipopolysaccharide transport system ATP-binding protein